MKLRFLLYFAFTVFTALQIQSSFAQDKVTVKGKVVDEENLPLIGVSVTVYGTKVGSQTDVNGNFQLTATAAAKSLKFTYLGFEQQTVAISNGPMVVKLKQQSNTLSDVVVIGYQTVKKKDVTGAVANIGAKDFNQGNVTNSILQIQGKVAGLSIVQSSGDPNSSPTIRLRGQTSLFGGQNPLCIVDGVQLDNIDLLNNIPPGDIASYDVLKDASATAIYGSRGANGVIIVTTKRGVSGQTKVDYQGFTAIDQQAKYRNLLNGNDWRAQNPTQLESQYNVGETNTDWQRAITRKAFTQSHNVGISGGSKGFNYRGSINYINQDNIVINSGKEQIGIRFNAEQKAFNDKLTLGLGITNTITDRKYTSIDFDNVFRLSPGIPIYDETGKYSTFLIGADQYQNIVKNQNHVLNTAKENYTLYSGSAKLEILPGLKAGVVGTMSKFDRTNRYFRPTYRISSNSASKEANANESYRGEINASYDKSFGKHNFGVLSVYEYNYFTNNNLYAAADSIPYDFFQDNALEASTTINRRISSYRAENKLISLVGRFNYNYDNKYYFTATVRRDGSSKFGENNRWGTFPGATIAWRVTQEGFMKNVLWLNDLKLRAGFGETGNQDALNEYQSLRLRQVAGNSNVGKPTETTNFRLVQNENPFVQWEVRQGRNIGLDFALFNSRLSGDINYFNDITKKMLYTYETAFALPLPATSQRPQGRYVTANVGDLTNKGIEVALNFRAIENKDFNWTIGGQISGVRTKIKSLKDESGKYTLRVDKVASGKIGGIGDITYLVEGQTPFVMYLPKYLGIDSEGKQIVDTISNYVDPSPRFDYGVTNTFSYKSWGLSFFVRGVSGLKLYNADASILQTGFRNNFDNNGYNTTYEALKTDLALADNRISDRWLENASFIRLDNLSLSYSFKKFKSVQNLKLSVSGNNLFIITKFTGLDPEKATSTAINSNSAGSENYLNFERGTPRTRSFSFGVSASF